MTVDYAEDQLIILVNELCRNPKEYDWLEFKHNNKRPDEIGEQISALANSVALCGRAQAYVVWGIDDATHKIIGTTFSPCMAKVGNEELENWLSRLMIPNTHFRFFEIEMHGLPVVVLEISRATHRPIQFKGIEYIKVGSYTKKLKDYPEKERELWRCFDYVPFEKQIAAENLNGEDILKLLDYPAYFQLLKQPLPENREQILEALRVDSLITKSRTGLWNIFNLGSILFAKKLSDFSSLKRKAVRVVQYSENSRYEAVREYELTKGYACGFDELLHFINMNIPSNEVIGQALRTTVTMYPLLAVRELIANALIHQDFFITGAGPMIEIFKERIEITNPGKSLVDTMRLLDSPPHSRNEALASFMRRISICEERGSGIDKIVFETELYQLPPPLFESLESNMRISLFALRPLNKMDKMDRIRACYLHASLKYVMQGHMTNTSLRERFGIEAHNSADASRIIKSTLEAGLIRIYNPAEARKNAKYVPYWVG